MTTSDFLTRKLTARPHAFVSYPRPDRALVERMFSRLDEAELRAWVDDERIEAGTPNWEASIREAVDQAYALVLVCTPNTPKSDYVYAELKLAQQQGCRIIPIWARGEHWINCVPLGFANYQYIDCREERFDGGMERLFLQLRSESKNTDPKLLLFDSIEECPEMFVPILFEKRDGKRFDLTDASRVVEYGYHFAGKAREDLSVLGVNPAKYTSFEMLLNDIYTGFLSTRYSPYTYGAEWVLAKPSAFLTILALPWPWLRKKQNKPLIEMIPEYVQQRTPVTEYGFQCNRCVWAIVDAGFHRAFGLFTSNDTVANVAFSNFTKELEYVLGSACRTGGISTDKRLRNGIHRLDDLEPSDYRFKLVFSEYYPWATADLDDDTVFVAEDYRSGY